MVSMKKVSRIFISYVNSTHYDIMTPALKLKFSNIKRNITSLFLDEFLPRDATQSAVMPQYVVCVSIYLSVRPSVTFRYRDHIG